MKDVFKEYNLDTRDCSSMARSIRLLQLDNNKALKIIKELGSRVLNKKEDKEFFKWFNETAESRDECQIIGIQDFVNLPITDAARIELYALFLTEYSNILKQ